MAETLVVTPVRGSYVKETQHLSLNRSTRSAVDVEDGETLVVTPVKRRYPYPGLSGDVEERVLSAFGQPIPPSRVAAIAKANGIPYPDGGDGPKSIQRYECATWEYLRQVIDQLVENADSTNLKTTAAQLFAENIVRGRGFFADACMRCQSKNPQSTLVYVALAGFVNSYFPMVGDLLYRRLYIRFFQLLTHEIPFDEELMNATIKFLSRLINLYMVYGLDALKILQSCLDEVTEERVKSAVIFLKELNLPRGGQLIVVRERLEKITKVKKLKKEVRDMVEHIIAEESWNSFKIDDAIASELQSVMPELETRTSHTIICDEPLTNRDIFRDVYKPDKDFLKREKAYYLFRSLILGKGYWNTAGPLFSSKERKCFSDLAENPGIDHRLLCDTLLPITKPEDEDRFCLAIFWYLCSLYNPSSQIVLIEVLCKNDERYMEALETCFNVMWLMVTATIEFLEEAAQVFAELLHRGLLSWDFVAHLPFEPQDMARWQYVFLCDFFKFYAYKYDGIHSISENLFRKNYLCVPAAITFFRNETLDKVAADLERLSKAKNCTIDKVVVDLERQTIAKAKNYTKATKKKSKAKFLLSGTLLQCNK